MSGTTAGPPLAGVLENDTASACAARSAHWGLESAIAVRLSSGGFYLGRRVITPGWILTDTPVVIFGEMAIGLILAFTSA
jgi:hypothetical protein